MDHKWAPFKKLRKNKGLSERSLCQKAGLSRMTLRNIENSQGNVSWENITRLAQTLEVEPGLLLINRETRLENSTVSVAFKVCEQGFDSWKIFFMDFVDEFRRTWDPRLFMLPPPEDLDPKLKALLASIVLDLCSEAEIEAPYWATRNHVLSKPWFLSETEALKVSALVESPAFYKRNNIYVLENFLKRA